MIRSLHTFDSVVRELFQGLSDGTIVLDQEVENSLEQPLIARGAAVGITIQSVEDWMITREQTTGFIPEIVPLAEVEREAILRALEKLNGDELRTAQLLGIEEDTLARKMKDYGLEDWPSQVRAKTAKAGQS